MSIENAKKALILHEPPDDLPEDEPCTPRERAFARAYMENGCKASEAAKAAGYTGSTALDFAKAGYQVLQRQRVVDLVIALSKKDLRSLAPEAVRAIAETIRNPFGKDRLRAVQMVLDRVDGVTQRIEGKIEHVHKVDHRKDALEQLRMLKQLGVPREKLEELFGYGGLPALEQQLAAQDALANSPIEAEFTEIVPERDPDADAFGE
jgi:hypothetical protein